MLVLGLVDVPLWLILIIVIVVAYLWHNTRHFSFFKKQGIPGARPLPILGTIRMWGDSVKKFPMYELMQREKYGDIRAEFLGCYPAITVYDESIISQVMVKDFNNFSERLKLSAGDKLASDMLSNAEGAHWKKLRTIMSPTFSTGKLKRMMGEMNRCAAQFADFLAERHGKEIEIKSCCGNFTLDVIASTAFGMRLDSQTDEENMFVKHAKNVLKYFNLFIMITLFLPFILPVLRLLGKCSAFPKDVGAFFTDVVKQAISARNEDNVQSSRTDFLQLMINAQRGVDIRDIGEDADPDESTGAKRNAQSEKLSLTDDELVANCVLFFMAAYDTTASTVGFLLYNLAVNPECQETLVEEINNVVGETDVKYDMLTSMTYLDQCLCESLRLFPPAIATSREAKRDVTINGIHLKKGMLVNVPLYGLHHDKRRWPEPEKFIPERFSAENKGKHGPFDWMPFGYGPRNCIAMRMAQMEVKMAVIHVIRKIKFSACQKTAIPMALLPGGLLQPARGIWLKVENRKKKKVPTATLR